MTERTSRLETLIAGFVTQLGGKGRVSASQFANVKSAASLTLQVDELDAKLARGPHSREDSALYAKLVVERQAMFVAAGLTTTNANQPTDRQDESARAALARIVDGIKADQKRREQSRLAAAKPEPLQMLDGEDFTDVLLRRLADFGVFIPDGAPLDGQVIAPRPRLVEAVNHDPECQNPESRNQGGARDHCASPSTFQSDGPAGTKEATPSPNQALNLRKQTPTEQLTPEQANGQAARRNEQLFQEWLHGPAKSW